MRIHILASLSMLPVPNTLRIVSSWGHLAITSTAHSWLVPYTSGSHYMLEGELKDFINWLQNAGDFWLGVGYPSEERFVLAHIGESLVELPPAADMTRLATTPLTATERDTVAASAVQDDCSEFPNSWYGFE